MVKQAVFSLSKKPSCCKMGLRAEHIQEMVPDDDTGSLRVMLKRFVVYCANAEAPLSLQPYVVRANLTAL